MTRRFLALFAFATVPLVAQGSPAAPRGPVFDVHNHATFTPANVKAMMAAMDSLNVQHAIYIGAFDQIAALPDTTRDRLIPALPFPCDGGKMMNAGVQCFPADTAMLPDLGWLRSQVTQGRVRVFGELGAQYLGIAPNDPRLEPYFALAEELDVPVGIHLGIGPPAISASDNPYYAKKSPNYRGAAGDPYLLEDVLVRHPKLRLYVMHAAWPSIDRMLYLMCMFPRLYVDISVLQYAIARPAYYTALRTLVEAGLSDRVMFGSDGGPRFLAMGIDAIEQAPFLSESQKRDILYHNAMRFFRLAPPRSTTIPRVCGG
ncbi:MAG: amidohydrolase family protein [Gemmatimonadota bacterium]